MPSTPYLALDLERAMANIERAARWARDRGVTLRPHVKTHKIPELARLQREAGAVGITVATAGEAEVFVGAGFTDVFIAYPLWLDDDRRDRLSRLADQAALTIGCDSVAAGRLIPAGVRVLVEVDSGHHRTGVPPEAAGALAADLSELGVDVRGVFTFPGHAYAPDGRLTAARQETAALVAAAEAVRSAGVGVDIISGGSTPSLAESGQGATEFRPGVYLLNDAQQWELGVCSPEEIALTCVATVVSHAGGRAVLDCGSKALGADRAPWASGFGRLVDDPDARIVSLSEHHAVVDTDQLPALGSRVRVAPNHVCNAMNLAEEVVVLSSGRQQATWRVAARGCNT